MPFRIIRNDITKVKADAIVNTANPDPTYAAGTDSAIYRAAGADALLAERKKIGPIAPGEAAFTSAFRLHAKYIIHTVGPVWTDGRHGETDTLRSCYLRSLDLAETLGCKSIAFPLISAGTYDFPREEALSAALSVIREYLEHSDLDVILVVFGRESFQIASGLVERVEEYIDEKYVSEKKRTEYGSSFGDRLAQRRLRDSRVREQPVEDFSEESRESDDDIHERPVPQAAPFESPSAASSSPAPFGSPSSAPRPSAPRPSAPASSRPSTPAAGAGQIFRESLKKRSSLEDAISHLGESFQERLLRMIDERDMTDPEVYKRANLDRKLFSKIRCNPGYVPKKKTIIALAIALRLNLDETRDLLASAGLLLTNNSKADLIVRFCIENEIFDIYEVNALLFRFDQPILG